ncbi:hypothetical protein Tco_0089785 [Tanacetum coccineum]
MAGKGMPFVAKPSIIEAPIISTSMKVTTRASYANLEERLCDFQSSAKVCEDAFFEVLIWSKALLLSIWWSVLWLPPRISILLGPLIGIALCISYNLELLLRRLCALTDNNILALAMQRSHGSSGSKPLYKYSWMGASSFPLLWFQLVEPPLPLWTFSQGLRLVLLSEMHEGHRSYFA